MRTVWKFPLPLTDAFDLEMPFGAEILSLQTQGGQPCIWVLVDPAMPNESRRFRLAGTGHSIQDEEGKRLKFVDTFQIHGGALVFHVFECVKEAP